MKSALDNPSVVDKYLATEVKDIWASRSRDPADGPHQSFWGHPQKSQTREMVPDSGPRGASVNDDIEKELCSLINEAMREVIALHGPGDPAGKI